MSKEERNLMTDKLIKMLERIDEIDSILNEKEKEINPFLSTSQAHFLSSREEIQHI